VRGGPRVRSAGLRLDLAASRAIDAGHPWVFRSGVLRVPEVGLPGDIVPVVDEEGRPLGAAVVEGDSSIAARMVSRDPEFRWTAGEIRARIEGALDHRARHLDARTASARRLIHGEADGFPGLAVDRYGDYLVVYLYARSAEALEARLVDALAELVEPRGVYVQDRTHPVSAEERRPAARLARGVAAPPEVIAVEDGLSFVIDPSAPVSPGLFLDLREGRRLADGAMAGKHVLNLFSFTGAFGVRAVRAGAASVTQVDAAPRSHARCRQNLAASGLDPEAIEALTGDAFKFLERFRQRGRAFDYVVVDPPPFSSVKGSTFSAMQDWSLLMSAIAGVVAPGGHVLAVSNATRVGDDELMNAIGQGVRHAGRRASLVHELGLPPDFPVIPAFPEGRYLRVKLLAFSA
jgi:23S rRNA (cytosine1962-C5)-methyltransferase